MAINSQHPAYAACLDDWRLMRDLKRGERFVKDRGEVYLPATAGMYHRGMSSTATGSQPGLTEYNAYKKRAVVPDLVPAGIAAMVGIMHRKDAVIEVPGGMESWLDEITQEGESAQGLLRRMTEEILTTGRIGLVVDVEDGVNTAPYIATYNAETVINWYDGAPGERRKLRFVILDESTNTVGEDFNWTAETIYRVLYLDDSGQYATFTETQGLRSAEVEPMISGNRLDRLPFVFVGSTDLTSDPNEIPLLGLGRLSMTIYRAEADYRHTLYMTGQDTLVIKGPLQGDELPFVGAGAWLNVDAAGDAKYIGVSATGLPEQRAALENDYRRAAEMGARLLSATGGDAESGEALRIRVAARTASLASVAQTAAAGLEDALKIMAEWAGMDADAVSVVPNIDFADDPLAAREVLELMQAKAMGAPLSRQSVHDLMREREMTMLSYEEEIDLIEQEGGDLDNMGRDAGAQGDGADDDLENI